MRNAYFAAVGFAFLLGACGAPSDSPDREKNAAQIKEEIRALETQLAASPGTRFDTGAALQIVEKTELLIEKYPADTAAAALVFRAADVARGAGEIEKAIILWGLVNRNYEDFERAPEALFLQGFTADQDLRDSARAARYYQYFLQRHSEHYLAKDAELLLQALQAAETPDDLVRKFQEQGLEGE